MKYQKSFISTRIFPLILLVKITTSFVVPITKSRRISKLYSQSTSSSSISFENLLNKKILVVGGSGRVGGSVVTQLVKHGSVVTVGGQNIDNFESAKERWKALFPALNFQNINFEKVNRQDCSSFLSTSYDIIINTAGPFQGKSKQNNGVLEFCAKNAIKYIDVCDDYNTAMVSKSNFTSIALENNAICIVSTGCWPGVSSLMAKKLLKDKKKDQSSVEFSFYTAGSGGAGSTLLVATFLILAEKALSFIDNQRFEIQPMKKYNEVDFGKIVGNKDVSHLNLLETASIHDVLSVPTTSSKFGTDPPFWNALLGVMAQIPPSILSNENLMTSLALFSLPVVRFVDMIAGATNAMRCDVTDESNGVKDTMIYAHENLEPCVGECVVAFCAAIDFVRPGIWFPEEAIDDDSVDQVLLLASIGAHTLELNGKSIKT